MKSSGLPEVRTLLVAYGEVAWPSKQFLPWPAVVARVRDASRRLCATLHGEDICAVLGLALKHGDQMPVGFLPSPF